MQYPTLFDPIPWQEVGLTALQSFLIYWMIFWGLKIIGRRTLGELGPSDLILLLILSESTDVGLIHPQAGFWGTVASILVLLFTVAIVERVPALRKAMESRPIILMEQGQIDETKMNHYMVDLEDLDRTARDYGFADRGAFKRMTLEGDGKITGVINPESLKALHHANQSDTPAL